MVSKNLGGAYWGGGWSIPLKLLRNILENKRMRKKLGTFTTRNFLIYNYFSLGNKFSPAIQVFLRIFLKRGKFAPTNSLKYAFDRTIRFEDNFLNLYKLTSYRSNFCLNVLRKGYVWRRGISIFLWSFSSGYSFR